MADSACGHKRAFYLPDNWPAVDRDEAVANLNRVFRCLCQPSGLLRGAPFLGSWQLPPLPLGTGWISFDFVDGGKTRNNSTNETLALKENLAGTIERVSSRKVMSLPMLICFSDIGRGSSGYASVRGRAPVSGRDGPDRPPLSGPLRMLV